MQLNSIARKTKNRKIKRLGRSGNRGKTSGRGTKGQKARAGHRIRPEIRDVIKRMPKRRGFGKNRAKSVVAVAGPRVISVGDLGGFEAGEIVTPATLVAARLVSRIGGKAPAVKILGDGEITKALSFEGVTLSKSAREKITKVGGTIK